MGDTLLVILPASLPEGTCWPADPDAYQKLILGLARVKLPASSGGGVVIGQNAPGSTDWDKLWVRTDSSGSLIRQYLHDGHGLWTSPHPEPPSTSKRYLWVGVENDLLTFDEGADEPVGDVTGPFWQVDHAFDGRFPVAPGIVDDDLTIAVGDQAGEKEVKLTTNQIAAHKHLSPMRTRLANLDVAYTDFQGTVAFTDTTGKVEIDTNHYDDFLHAYTDFNPLPDASGDDPGGVQAHNNMPPYRGVFIIKRTARKFYKVA